MSTQILIRPAQLADLERLPEVERAAAALFPADRLPEVESTLARSTLDASLAAGLLFVAVAPAPVGFSAGTRREGYVYIEEVSVHPEHGRKGLGRQLVACLIEAARAQGFAGLALTTFSDLPWNGPFYASMGFEVAGAEGLPSFLASELQAQQSQLVQRVAMLLHF